MKKIIIITLYLFIFASNLYAQNNKDFLKSIFFNYENDSIFGSDRYYSNGIQFSFVTKNFEGLENNYITNIFDIKNKHYHNFSFGLGQKIYTPSSIKRDYFLKYDRPYAGYLYFFVNKTIFHDENKYDTLGATIGATGPISMAKWSQKTIHRLIGSPIPQGWKYQLSNEPLLMFSWLHMETINKPIQNKYDWNLIPKLLTNIGTPFTDVRLALEYRYGWNLQNDLSPNKSTTLFTGILNKPNNLSYYAFFEVEGNFVIYNTFLDGNLFRKNKFDIEKKLFRFELIIGGVLNYKDFYTKISNIYLSKEFKEQEHNQLVFSLTFGWLFGK